MKKSVTVETEETKSRTETENLLGNTPRIMSDPGTETSSSASITSEEVKIKSIISSPLQVIARNQK